MTTRELDLMQHVFEAGRQYLEYGAGESTKLAVACPTITSITSAEADPDYIEKQLLSDESIRRALQSGRLKFNRVDIGPVGDWSYPKDLSRHHLWPNYALSPFVTPFSPDVVLIDGRFRVACCLVCCLEAPDATLLIHDFTDRPAYQVLLPFITITQQVDTLVRCRRSKNFDVSAARALLRIYSYKPGDLPDVPVSRFKKLARIFG
jgi:hypothetical protein